MTEVVDIFPSEYIHVGGDECSRTKWKECPHCQVLIKELGIVQKDGISPEVRLQSYVLDRVKTFLSLKGKKLVCCNEAMDGGIEKDVILCAWKINRGETPVL